MQRFAATPVVTICTLILFGVIYIVLTSPPPADIAQHSREGAQTTPIATTTNISATETVVTDTPTVTAPLQPAPSPARIDDDSAEVTQYYPVVKVVDGDTIDVNINGTVERLRIIGINTPETVDPRKPVECFGKEASDKAKELLTGQRVRLEADELQDNRDKYGRLLRYVWRDDEFFFNEEMIKQGYAYEYTYNTPYRHQTQFRAAQAYARQHELGLWAPAAGCVADESADEAAIPPAVAGEHIDGECMIKGNISYTTQEKIYHTPGCDSYEKTIINEEKGERYFCSETEAVAAGWRKALNCP